MNALPSATTLSMALWAFWAIGCGLLALLSVWPATHERVKSLWSLMLGEALILAAVSLPLLLGKSAALLALLAGAWRLGWENGEVSRRWAKIPEESADLVRWFAATATVIASAVWAWLGTSGVGALAAFAFGGIAVAGWRISNRPLAAIAAVILYPGLPLGALAIAVSEPDNYPALLLAFLYVEVFDSLSLLGGRLTGRTAIFPWLSPRKTLEGLLTGAAGLLAASAALNAILLHIPWRDCLIVTLAAAVSAVAGDLLASLPKRLAGVKDYPAILPGHGGLQDIIDAWIIAGPVVCVAYWLLAK